MSQKKKHDPDLEPQTEATTNDSQTLQGAPMPTCDIDDDICEGCGG
jgi:hypothetical protein